MKSMNAEEIKHPPRDPISTFPERHIADALIKKYVFELLSSAEPT